MEYLVTMTTRVPEGTPDRVVTGTEAREAERARELAEQGHLERLWMLGPGRVLGLWQASGPADMQAILKSLPDGPLDGRADYAADRAPERPGHRRDLTAYLPEGEG